MSKCDYCIIPISLELHEEDNHIHGYVIVCSVCGAEYGIQGQIGAYLIKKSD